MIAHKTRLRMALIYARMLLRGEVVSHEKLKVIELALDVTLCDLLNNEREKQRREQESKRRFSDSYVDEDATE